MRLAVASLALVLASSFPAVSVADDAPSRIETRDAFVATVSGRDLTVLGITLKVLADGTIDGRAFGRKVSGDWSWQDGFFCRDLYFGTQALGPNCQVVERRGAALRFIADKGAGDHADLRLR